MTDPSLNARASHTCPVSCRALPAPRTTPWQRNPSPAAEIGGVRADIRLAAGLPDVHSSATRTRGGAGLAVALSTLLSITVHP